MSDIATRVKTGLNISLRTVILTAVVLAVGGTGIYLAVNSAIVDDKATVTMISATGPSANIKVIMGKTTIPPQILVTTRMTGKYLDKILLSSDGGVDYPLSIKNDKSVVAGNNSSSLACYVSGLKAMDECVGSFTLSGFSGLGEGEISRTYTISVKGFANKSNFVPSCKDSSCLKGGSSAPITIKVVRNTVEDCTGAGYGWDEEKKDCKETDNSKPRSGDFYAIDATSGDQVHRNITVQKGSDVTVGWVTSGFETCTIFRSGTPPMEVSSPQDDKMELRDFLKKTTLIFKCKYMKTSTFKGVTSQKLSGWQKKGTVMVKVKDEPAQLSLFAKSDDPENTDPPVDGEITVASPPSNGVTVTWTAKYVMPGSCTIEEVEKDADPPVYDSRNLITSDSIVTGTENYAPEKTADINLYCQDMDGKDISAKPLKVFVDGVPWVKISADGCGLTNQTGFIAMLPGVPNNLKTVQINWESKNVDSVPCKLSRVVDDGTIPTADPDVSVDANGSKSFGHSDIVATGNIDTYVSYTITCANGQNTASDSLVVIHSPDDSGTPPEEVVDPGSGTDTTIEVPGTDTGDSTTVVEPSTDNPDTSTVTPVSSPAKVSSAADITYGNSQVASPGKSLSLASQCIKSSDKTCRVSLQFDNFKTPGLYQYTIKVNDKAGKNRSTKKVSMLVLGAGQEAIQPIIDDAIASGLTAKQAQEMLVYSANRGININNLSNVLSSTSNDNLLGKILNKLLNL